MKLRVGSGGPPVGVYTCRFVGTEKTEHEKWGPGLAFRQEILDGPQATKIASRITGPEPSLTNGCGKMCSALAGRPLVPGEAFDPDDYIGQIYIVTVEATDSGGTRIGSMIKAPEAQ